MYIGEMLDIDIVGGGLGGLATAIAFRRQGHFVEVFEASSATAFNELGAAIGCPPNAVRILKSLGITVESIKGVEYAGITSLDHQSGTVGLSASLGDIKGQYGHVWCLCHRVDLHEVLQRMAFGEEGEGPPAKLSLGTRAVSWDPKTNELALSNGETRKPDLLIAADGINSALRSAIVGQDIVASPTGVASYRWLLDSAKLDNNPQLDWVIRNGPSGPRMVTSPDFRVLFLYPCRGKTIINAMGIHMDDRIQTQVGFYVPSTQAKLLEKFKDFGPQYQQFLELTDEEVGLWQLRSMPDLSTWINGRSCLLGDSAHAMLPTIGQGAAMAFEDAITLAHLIPLDTPCEDIPRCLSAYEFLRKERADFVKGESLDQFIVPQKRALYYRSPELQKRVMGFDAAATAREYKRANFE
ncbi:FAD/NAD(P)-binding domain-containing protein [Lentinula aff. detonsa]|nr:FAD/NAD(P)-binding domain-containing protein [Lentinula aff. detonsa]